MTSTPQPGDRYTDSLRRSRDELQRALAEAREHGQVRLADELAIGLRSIKEAIGREMGAFASPSPVSTPDTQEAVSAEVIVCAGVIVGVGGESDPCVTQAQADRATRLIVRELTKHGLLRPAMPIDDQAVERAVVLPENWRTRVNATRPSQITTLIESWRPSTGDTDGTAEQWRLDEREIDGGFAGTEYPRLWPPRQAALHAEPEPAWGEGRPVHGHTEQTGGQT